MTAPKCKKSKSRTRIHRIEMLKCQKSIMSNVANCKNCNKVIIPHNLCLYCGFYKGRLVVRNTPYKV